MTTLGLLLIVASLVGFACWRAGISQGFEEGLERGHRDAERWIRNHQAKSNGARR